MIYTRSQSFEYISGVTLGMPGNRFPGGIPGQNTYLHSIRDGQATDDLNPRGIYIGTRSGQIFYSRGIADNWELLID